MKVQVAEATNIQLDWLVAKALGGVFGDQSAVVRHSTTFPCVTFDPSSHYLESWFVLESKKLADTIKEYRNESPVSLKIPRWKPTTNWAQGGPIIYREGILNGPSPFPQGEFAAGVGNEWDTCKYISYGPTPLIAAMRCYVASKLGDEVEVPDELA